MARAILIDTSKCSACRGCQVACKQWNDLPAEKTRNQGSYQNPARLSAITWKLVTFHEVETQDGANWLFLPMQCLHCTEASCVSVCPTGAAHHHGGAVLIDQGLCIGCGYCVQACPFSVPHSIPGLDGHEKGTARKCSFCMDRVSHGQEPACVKTCPMGAYQFGERSELVVSGVARAQQLRAQGYSDAYLYGEKELGGTQIMFVLKERPALYGLPEAPRVAVRNILGQWLSGLVGAGLVAAVPFWLLTKRKRELAKKTEEVLGP
jgi:formate dehydrogenase iron-sulfur subunit